MCLTKQCFICKEEKEISLFYKHPKMRDGYLNKCIECTKKYSKQHRKNNQSYYIEYETQRKNSPPRKTLAKQIQTTYRQQHPDRYKAVCILNNNLRYGKILKTACVICGSTKTVGHHVSYDLPLDVTWLCQKHHKELHVTCY